MLHIFNIFVYSGFFFPRYFYCSHSMFVITIKKREKTTTNYLLISNHINAYIYFFSFLSLSMSASYHEHKHTHTFPTIINDEKTSRTVWYSPISLFFLTRTIIWVSLFSIYIHSQLFFFAPFSLAFFFFFTVCSDHSGRRRRINLREHSTINK